MNIQGRLKRRYISLRWAFLDGARRGREAWIHWSIGPVGGDIGLQGPSHIRDDEVPWGWFSLRAGPIDWRMTIHPRPKR